MLSLLYINANVSACVCVRSCLLSFCHSLHPVWRLGTVTAWRWWTTCRKPSFCACRRWICTEPLILTSASLVRLAETDNPRQVTHTRTDTRTHTHFLNTATIHKYKTVTVQLHHKAYVWPFSPAFSSSVLYIFTLYSSFFCLLSPSVWSFFPDWTDQSGEQFMLYF